MSKHSPGPWTWSSGGFRLEDYAGTPVIGINRVSGGMYVPGSEDAKLLEAAPDLLDALKTAVAMITYQAQFDVSAVDGFRALIKRIEGE